MFVKGATGSSLILTTPYPSPDSKVHGANMGPTWVLSAPYGPHVGPMNLAIRVTLSLPWTKWSTRITVECWLTCAWPCHKEFTRALHCKELPVVLGSALNVMVNPFIYDLSVKFHDRYCDTMPYHTHEEAMERGRKQGSVYAPSQWEMTLHSKVISHWLGAYKKWSLWGVESTTEATLKKKYR